MTLRIIVKSAEFKEVSGEGRWNADRIATTVRRYSEIRGLHGQLEKANTLLGGLKLPTFPSWFRLKAGYTNMMPKEDIEQRMTAIENYLNELTRNRVTLSTKYFTEFLGLSIKYDKDKIVAWINSNNGYILYKEQTDDSPIKYAIIGGKSVTATEKPAIASKESPKPSTLGRPGKESVKSPSKYSSKFSPKGLEVSQGKERIPTPEDSEMDADIASISEEGDARTYKKEERKSKYISDSESERVRDTESPTPKHERSEEISDDEGNIKDDEDEAQISDDDEEDKGKAKPTFMSVHQILLAKSLAQSKKL